MDIPVTADAAKANLAALLTEMPALIESAQMDLDNLVQSSEASAPVQTRIIQSSLALAGAVIDIIVALDIIPTS